MPASRSIRPKPPRRLLASIHDVGPRFLPEVERLAARLSDHLGGARFAMLVVPDHWGEAPIKADRAFQARLRRWADDGVEMFLHGWSHRDDSVHEGRTARFKAKHMTAREGEFLGLDRLEAMRRMREGRALVEDIIGRPVAGFIAPAWLYGQGALAAMEEVGFALAEDHMRVWRPLGGATLARGPVITWASRSKPRIASSLFFAALARQILTVSPNVRVAVHPGDDHVPAILRSVDRVFSRLLRTHAAGRYADLG